MPSENSPTLQPTSNASSLPVAIPFWDTFAFGTICGLVSAMAYLAANACLRSLTRCDPVWVSAIKAVPTVLLTGPWLLVRANRGLKVLPTFHGLVALICAGLIGQLGGNISFQWSLGVIGLALSVPLCLAAQIIGAVGLGRMFLRESISIRTAGALGMLVAATAILSLGANDAHEAVTKEMATTPSLALLMLGVSAALTAGLAYAALGVIIRRGLNKEGSVSTTLFIICLLGTVVLGAIGYYRIGFEGILAISSRDYGIMFLGGVFNAIAFLSLTKSLQLVPVVYANGLAASQAGLAALAGVMLFAEPPSISMLIGVGLTVAGLLSMRSSKEKS